MEEQGSSGLGGSLSERQQERQVQQQDSMDCDTPASSAGGWGLALASQQQQRSSGSQLHEASGFPCSIASLFEDTSQSHVHRQQETPQHQPGRQQHPDSAGASTGPRFFLEYVVLENFKSYKGRHVVGPLQSSVAIIGANGSGKSNIADAICFGLGVTGRSLRSNALADLCHTASEASGTPVTAVSLHFRLRGASDGPGGTLLLRRQISSSNTSPYSVDGTRVTAEEYRRVLSEKLSLGPHTIAASLLLQGDTSVTNAARSPLELTRLIERVGSSEDWADQFAAAESRAATLRREARAAFSSKQQLLAALRVLQAQKKEVNTYKEMEEKLHQRRLEYLMFQLYIAEQRATQQQRLAAEEASRSEELLQQLQQTLQEAEAADQRRISISAQLDQRITLAKKQALKTSMLRAEMVECLEKLRFAEQRQQQEQLKLQQKQQECDNLRNLENELCTEVIRLADEQQRIREDTDAKAQSLKQRLSQQEHETLLQLQQQTDCKLTEIKQQIANKQPLLQQATSSLDILEKECVELERRIVCLRELESEAQQKQTAAAETLQQLLKEAAEIKQAIAEANEQAKTSGTRREELRGLQGELQQQLSLVRGLKHDSQQQQQLLQVYEDLRTKAMLQDAVHGTAGDCCVPSNKRFAAAIFAAVGRWRNALVVKDVASATAAIQYLRTNCLQAVDFLPLDKLREQRQRSSGNAEIQDFTGEGGSFYQPPNSEALPAQCRWAVDCVTCDSLFRPVVEFVLSDCIVVPSLHVAQHLKSSGSFGRFRFVTLEGERLQHSGIFSIEGGYAVAAATARMHSLQHDELLRRAEEVTAELQKIDILESSGADTAQRRQLQLDRLHRLALQQQTKQKAWEQQQEHQGQQLQQLLQQHAQLKQRCEAQQKRAATLSKELEELQEAFADAQASCMSGFAKKLQVSQAELRDLLLLQQQQQQQSSAAAKLNLQQLRLEAELKDCRSRLEAATQAAEAVRTEQQQHDQREQLTRQLAKHEEQLDAAERQHQQRIEQQEEQQKLLQEVEGQLQELRKQSDRLLREKAAAVAAENAAQQQQQQQYTQVLQVLRQADVLGVELPLRHGTWKDVQQFLCLPERPQQRHSQNGAVFPFAVDWETLPADRRTFVERHIENEPRLLSELRNLQQYQQELQQQLQQLNPNFKADQKVKELEAQVQQQEEDQQKQRIAATEAEEDLRVLRTKRKNAFMKCFLHCQRVLSLIFAHLSAGGPLQDTGRQGFPNLPMLEDHSAEAWQEMQHQQQRHFDTMGGQAFLDLESSTAVTRDEEPFRWCAAIETLAACYRLKRLPLL